QLLYLLYTSGTTAKPKGIMHTTGGYMTQVAFTHKYVFDLQPDVDVYWCAADIGWVTGHSYIVYGPMLNGATTVMFEGVPTWPSPARFWEVCEKLKVNQFYTAPTAIRALAAKGDHFVDAHDRSSLRVLGTVGEPINPEAWLWYADVVGQGRCALVDTWWQTETGGILISGLGALSPMKPAHAGLPLPGIEPVLVDGDGNTVEGEAEGYLCIARPWPSMIRTTYGDHERCRNVYFSAFKGKYFTGDGARRDADGMFRIIGRVDDVVNVSGHRFGTAEIEDAIDSHPAVAESAVIGYPHPIKGQAVHAYVILKEGTLPDTAEGIAALRKEIGVQVNTEIGNIARPDRIQFTPGLPKTRSGKIMRRILRKVASGEHDQLGDTSTLLDPTVVDGLVTGAAEFLA
ncbi:MAG: AMP-binding protein, partial [Flavobacteriales bacterium]